MKALTFTLCFVILVACANHLNAICLDNKISENRECYEEMRHSLHNILSSSSSESVPDRVIGYKPMHRKDGYILISFVNHRPKIYSLHSGAMVKDIAPLEIAHTTVPDIGYLQNTTTDNLSDANCYVIGNTKRTYFFTSTHLHKMKDADRSAIRHLLKLLS